MTQTQPAPVACPQCHATESVPLSDGVRLCLGCRNEWNPATTPTLALAPTPPSTAPTPPPGDNAAPHSTADPSGAPTTVDDVLGPPPVVVAEREAQAALDALIGTQVVLEGGQTATIEAFPDDDHVAVRIIRDDDTEQGVVVDFNDVVRSIDAPPTVADVDDDTAAALSAANMAIAGLVIRAGIATVAGEYPDAQLITPPAGWLPLDPDALPMLEQGVAYALAFVIHGFSLDRETLAAMADMLISDSETINNTRKVDE